MAGAGGELDRALTGGYFQDSTTRCCRPGTGTSLRRILMAGHGRWGMSHFDDFLRETTSSEPGSDSGLSTEELYGLYMSWCALTECPPEPPKARCDALTAKGITPGQNTSSMTGPAAADYILFSVPDLP